MDMAEYVVKWYDASESSKPQVPILSSTKCGTNFLITAVHSNNIINNLT